VTPLSAGKTPMAEVSEHHLMLVHQDLIKVALSAILNAPPTSPLSDQSVGRTALQAGKILVPNVKRSLTAEPPASQSIPAHPDTTNPELFATPIARLVTMELDLSAGNPAHPAGLILVRSAVSHSMSMEKDAVVQSSAVVAVHQVTLMMVALAEDHHKQWPKVAMVTVLVSHWVAEATKISMELYAIQNAKLVTKESVQSAGKSALRALLTPEQPA
jgi:hypothetical protein